jgi:hypothetical protein
MKLGRTLCVAAVLVLIASVGRAADTPDPGAVRLTCSDRPSPSLIAEARTQATAAVAPIEAEQTARLAALDRSDTSGATAASGFAEAQRRYQRARFAALYPLAKQGNAVAVFALAAMYRNADGGFADAGEWHRLVACASVLGDSEATVQLAMLNWHDKGDATFAAIQKNRATALDLVEKAADGGDLGGILTLAVYVGGGFHQYPSDAELGRRIFVLCARAGVDECKWRLVDAGERRLGYALRDPAALYRLLADQAQAQPARYAARRDAARAALSDEAARAAENGPDPWRTQPWPALKPEWRTISQAVLARGCPSSVACRLGVECRCGDH